MWKKPPKWNRGFAEEAASFVLAKIDANLQTFTEKFPSASSVGLVYRPEGNEGWTTGFWTGMLWLAYELTGDGKYRRTAEIQLEDFRERAFRRLGTDTHDLGFLYTLSCVAAVRLTGNEEARRTALEAADLLMERYFDKAGIIQAWGDLNDPAERGRMIVDCCMNLPLLYWASEKTGNGAYAQAAARHAERSAACLVREDASTYHTFYMDVDSGAPKYGQTHQGYADDSCWARGQAWAIYGFPLSYRYTGDRPLLELTRRLAHYFLNRLPDDRVAYWDLIFTDGPQERDSSASAIAACGLLELAGHLEAAGDESGELYRNAALHTMQSLSEHYTTKGDSFAGGILKHAVYNKPRGMGIDECCIWGDYFYLEAIVRTLKDWRPYW
nr:glycoside hydrolase family 88 protein [Cohnella sp. CFH 77786]